MSKSIVRTVLVAISITFLWGIVQGESYAQTDYFPDRSLKTNRPDSAFYMVKSLYLQAEKDSDLEALAHCSRELGEILFYLGDFDNANQYLISAAEFFENTENKAMLAEVKTWQGIVSQYARQSSLSLSHYTRALETYEQLQDSIKIGELYGWIGHYYEKQFAADTALDFQYKALRILQKQDADETSLARIYDNIGSLYEDKASYDSAHYYFFKSLAINRRIKDINSKIVNLNNIGDVFRKKRQFGDALFYTDSALKIADQFNIPYQQRSAHRDFSKIYFELADYEKAYHHLDQAYAIYTDILNEESSKRIAVLQTIYESERQDNQIKLLEKDQRINQILRLVFIIAILVLLLVGFFVVRSQKVKVKQSRKIIEQKTDIYEKEKALNKLELQNAILNEEKLRATIDQQKFVENQLQQNIELKSQLITSQTLQIIRKNKFLEKLKVDLQQIKKSDKQERLELINSLMKSINNDITCDENWNDFSMVFSQVHKDFFTKLKQKYPDISSAEMRLCALLKLNLHSQEIATILGISTDSLRIARYRLRKKLQLDKNDRLIGVLTNI